MSNIFISYRRDDTGGYATAICDRLSGSFRVFMDVRVPAGAIWQREIADAIATGDVLIALIGREWVSMSADGLQPRLFDPEDKVRLEIVSALRAGLTVIPLLVDGAALPSSEKLPEDLRPLLDRQALHLRADRWDQDLDNLIQIIKATSGERKTPKRRFLVLAGVAVLLALMIGVQFWPRSGGSADLRGLAASVREGLRGTVCDGEGGAVGIRAAAMAMDPERQSQLRGFVAANSETIAGGEAYECLQLLLGGGCMNCLSLSDPSGPGDPRKLVEVLSDLAAGDDSGWKVFVANFRSDRVGTEMMELLKILAPQ